MTFKHIVAALFPLLIASGAQAQARPHPCGVPQQLDTARATPLLKSLVDLFHKGPRVGLNCGSLSSVMSKMLQDGKTGGRRLEADKGLNVAAADEEWQSAIRDPEIAKKLNDFKNTGVDQVEFLLFQAAVMDENGYYGARDLVIGVLTGQVK